MTVFTGTAGNDSLPNPQLLGVVLALGNDVFHGLGGDDLLVGYTGNDVLDGGAGADTMIGGLLNIVANVGTISVSGIDTADYSTSSAGVTVDLGATQNLVLTVLGIQLGLVGASTGHGGDAEGDTLVGITNLTGSAQADHLSGNADNNTILGGDGNDVLHGGAGADILDGGNGSDFANYQGSSAGVTVDLLAHTASGGDATGDVLTSIENLYGSSNADHFTGDNGVNIIGGELGDDVLVGNGGNDVLAGEGGNDTLDGGDGNDRLVGADGSDTIHGGTGADSIDGGTGNDTVTGDDGNDVIYGGAGDDQLDGGANNDVLFGGAGADSLIGGTGTDTALYAGSTAGVTVNLATGVGTGGDAQGDTLTGIENIYGSEQGDHLTGDAGNNILAGLGGDDVITGGVGADVLKGGAGNDTFVYTSIADSTVAPSGKDLITDFTTGDKIDLSAIDADGNAGNGDTAFSFGTGGFTGHAGEVRIVDFHNGVQGVYLDTNGDRIPESIINVISDHALTASDFVL